MAGPLAGGGTGAVVIGGHPVTVAVLAAVAALAVGWASSAAAGTAAAVSPAEAIRVRRVSGRRAWLLPGSGVGEVIRVAFLCWRADVLPGLPGLAAHGISLDL